MVRLAGPGDAAALFRLNELFNGPSGHSVEAMAESLAGNGQEVVVVAEEGCVPVGFVCAQVKRSFCYERPTAEVTEVFVEEGFRRRGLAEEMLRFLQERCAREFGVEEFTLLTGLGNLPAQALYKKLGYAPQDEVMFAMEGVSS